ncbi:autotransporter domain-containing protein [Fusobacterium sp. PH5-44]|uniref:autotransporter domain-containing protein n=1 Tax=unclassified Fusobacterium TaxID=2648384 RepID=UPI003D257560
MRNVSLKSKILALLTVAALMTSCGGGGGGGGGSSSGGNNTNTPGPSVSLPNSERNNGKGTVGKFDKNFSNKTALIGVIDSSFDMNRLSEISKQISVDSENHGTGDRKLGNGFTHGENVVLIITKDSKDNYIYAAGAAKGDNLSIDSNMYINLYNNGVRVFNQSFGSPVDLTASNYPKEGGFIKFYKKAVENNAIFLWATGNESEHSNGIDEVASSDARLPELYSYLEKGWIAVTAVDSNTGLIADYANYIGKKSQNWGIAAIGDYKIGSGGICGTSFATAAVSRATGKVMYKYPWMTPDIVKIALLTTADDKGAPGVDSVYGWGLLNEGKALNGPASFDKRLAFDSVGAKTDKITIKIDDDKQENLIDWKQFTFSNNISGDAGLILESTKGEGTLILSGMNTYSGDTIIKNAVLMVTNELNSKVEISAQGFLIANGNSEPDGSGTKRIVKINKDINNKSGLTVAGGGLKITGDYVGSSSSYLILYLDSKIHVTGTMDLGGGTVIPAISDDMCLIPSGTTRTVTLVQADGGIINNGNFDPYEDDNANDYFTLSETWSSNTLNVNYTRNSTAHVAAAMSYMSASVMNTGENLDRTFDRLALTEENSEFKSAASEILRTPAALLPRTLDSLSGEIYASAQNLTFKQSRETNRNLSERLHLINSEENRGGTGVWFNFLGADGEIYQKGYAKADTELWGGQVGLDTALTDRFIIGGSVSATKGKADFNKYAGKSESTSITASVYGIYNFGDDYNGLYTLGRLGVGFVDTDVERDIWINTKVDHLKASHDDTVYSAYVELGYKIPVNHVLTLTPYMGLSHDTVHRGSFNEKNSSFAIKSSSTTYDQTSAVFGLRAEAKFNRVKFHTTVQHMSAFGKEYLSFKAKYVGDTSGDHIKVKGASLPKNTTWVGVGADVELTENLSINASYNVSIERSRVSDNVGSIGFRFKF